MRRETKSECFVFGFAFLWVLIGSVLVQTVILPRFFPDNCSEAGLLIGSDADVCHQIALGEVERIKAEGLRTWTLMPTVDKVILAGMLSLLYVLTGLQSPLLFLPISALCHGVSALLLFRMMRMFKLPELGSLVGTAAFIVVPASFIWTLHPHKENLYIAAIFLFCFAVCKAFFSAGSMRDAAWSALACVAGILMVWMIRPFLVDVFCVGLVLGGAIALGWALRRRVRPLLPAMFLLFGVGGFFLPQFYAGGAFGTTGTTVIDYTSQLPSPISRPLHDIAKIRSHFLEFNEGATLVVDSEVHFGSDFEVLAYIPRAVVVGLLSPVGTCTLSGGALFFAAHALLYLGCLGAFLVWLARRRDAWPVILPLVVVMGIELVLRVMATPNVGSLWRYLYGFKSLVIAFGAAIAFIWIKDAFDGYRNHRHAKVMNETAIVVLGKVLTIVASLFGVRMMTEFLPQETYGELTLFLSVILVSQFAFGAALEQTAMRYYSIAEQKQAGRIYLRKLLGWWGIGSAVLAVLITALRFVLMPALPLAVLACIIVFAISGMGVNLGCGIQSAARNRLLVAGMQAGFEWLRYLLAVACILFFSVSVAAVLSGFVLAGIVILLAYVVSIARLQIAQEPSVEPSGNPFSNRYFWTMALGGCFTWVQVFADRWCIAKFLTHADIGVYQALYQISFSPSLIGSAMLLTVIAPILFHHSKDGRNVLEMSAVMENYNKLIGFLALACVGAFALAWMLRDVVPTVLLGEEYRDVSQYFPWMVLSGVLFMLSQQIMLSLCAGMRIGAILVVRAVTGVAAIACYGVGTALGGIAGAVAGGICLAFISVGINAAFHAALKRSYNPNGADAK